MGEIKNLNACAIATITTGIVLVHGFEGVGEAFEHVLGHPVWTHEMPMFADKAKALILEQHPDFPAEPPADFQALMAKLIQDWPEGIPIESGGEVRKLDPISSIAVALDRAKEATDGE